MLFTWAQLSLAGLTLVMLLLFHSLIKWIAYLIFFLLLFLWEREKKRVFRQLEVIIIILLLFLLNNYQSNWENEKNKECSGNLKLLFFLLFSKIIIWKPWLTETANAVIETGVTTNKVHEVWIVEERAIDVGKQSCDKTGTLNFRCIWSWYWFRNWIIFCRKTLLTFDGFEYSDTDNGCRCWIGVCGILCFSLVKQLALNAITCTKISCWNTNSKLVVTERSLVISVLTYKYTSSGDKQIALTW